MEFENGSLYKLSAEFLRIYSPAVDSKIRSIRGEKVTRETLSVFFPHWDMLFAIFEIEDV